MSEKQTANKLATLIKERLLGVDPDDQDLQLEDHDWQLIIDALTSAQPPVAGQTGKVRVKELKWVEVDLRAGSPPLVLWEAKTPFMTYTLESVMDRPWFCHFICAHFSKLDEAKAAVQADYERRILSAIEVSGDIERMAK